MTRPRAGKPAAARPGAARRAAHRDGWPLDAALVLLVVALALVVQRRVLGGAFAPDDLQLLEQARGLRPWGDGAWRLLSGRVFWTAAAAWFDGRPAPLHALVWLLHGACVAALFAFARAIGAPRIVGAAAAAWFGTHRLLWDTLLPISSVGEVLATLFALVATTLAVRAARPPGRVVAFLAFAAALLSKESVALVPLAGALAAGTRAGRRTSAALAVLGAVFMTALALTGDVPGGPAYALAPGWNVPAQLVAYAAAACDFTSLVPTLGAPAARVPGGIAFGALACAAAAEWRRTRLPAAGLAGFVLALGPVLLLRETRHLHYLYGPLAYLGIALAGAVAWLVEETAAWLRREPRGRPARPGAPASGAGSTTVAIVLAALVATSALHAERSIAQRESAWIREIGLPYDPLLRKMTVARNALETIAPLLAEDSVRLVIVQPPGTGGVYSVNAGARVDAAKSPPVYDLLTAVLDGGTGLRAVHPRIRDARIVKAWSPEFDGWWIASPYVNGRLELVGRAPEAHARLAELWWGWGFETQAIAYLDQVIAGGGGDSSVVRLESALRSRPAR